MAVKYIYNWYSLNYYYFYLFDINMWHNRNYGILGFYRGMHVNILRILPSTCITFLVFESLKTRIWNQINHLFLCIELESCDNLN